MFDRDGLIAACTTHGRVVRVVVTAVHGSAPREVGASMCVWADGQSGTIGGGAMEYELSLQARILTQDGFNVFPYCTEDLELCERLLDAGCEVMMPWGAPIGTGLGLNNIYGLRSLRAHFPDVPMVIDAGLGLPSQAAHAMELGFDSVLLNTAVAKAGRPAVMAEAFAKAVEAGALAQEADPMAPRDMAAPSTPVLGMPLL